jgi:hypothetical protein
LFIQATKAFVFPRGTKVSVAFFLPWQAHSLNAART